VAADQVHRPRKLNVVDPQRYFPDKVTLLDVPLLTFLKAISSWGLGLREMIEKGSEDQRVVEMIPEKVA